MKSVSNVPEMDEYDMWFTPERQSRKLYDITKQNPPWVFSIGLKHDEIPSILQNRYILIDVRGIHDPASEEIGKSGATGYHWEIQWKAYNNTVFKNMVLPRVQQALREQKHIVIGCNQGLHRSVWVAMIVSAMYGLKVYHYSIVGVLKKRQKYMDTDGLIKQK